MEKPQKPYAGYQLTVHPNGQFSKKINGKVHYFGPWSEGPIAALEKYLRLKPFIEAGTKPPESIYTVDDLVKAFLAHKDNLVRSGEIQSSTRRDYAVVCKAIKKRFGRREVASIANGDFSAMRAMLADGYSKSSLKQRLSIARMLFKYGKVETDGLRAPAKRLLRAEKRERLFTAEQIRYMLDNATGELRDLILLGINCAFGPKDCLTLTANRIKGEWIEHPRPKTGVDRRCWLWPETRPTLPPTLRREDIGDAFRELVADFYVPNVTTFYTLRRTFETIASAGDVSQAAIDKIMGHERPDMASIYRQRVFDGQLRKCSAHVRAWVFGEITLA
jgi:integrase